MDDHVPGYYRPTQEEFGELWQNGLIILDTNVLLDLYRIKKTTSDDFLQTLREYSKQLWMPHQVKYEFQKNRNEVIIQQREKYAFLITVLKKDESALSDELAKCSKHPFIDTNKIHYEVLNAFQSVIAYLEKLETEHPDLIQTDPIFDEINLIYQGKIGEEYSETRLMEIFQEGEERYRKKIPPGFKDADKPKNANNERYGDLVLWYQIIDKAKSCKKPVIFVTSEQKGDWWHIIRGHKIGPLSQLTDEIKQQAGVLFYLYHSDRFLQYAHDYLKQTVDKKTITELQEIRSAKEIAEAKRDREVRIEATRDSIIIGNSVEVMGYSYTDDDYVHLILFGPGEYIEGREIATPEVSDTRRWNYLWDPGHTIRVGLYTFVVYDALKQISDEVTVNVEKGAVTIVAQGTQSYYIGEKIKFFGTSTASKSVSLAIRGITVAQHMRKLDDLSIISKNDDPDTFVNLPVREDCTWSYIWDTGAVGKFLRAGTYTIVAIESPIIPDEENDKAFGTVSVIIKKPFVSATASHSVVAQGDRIIITGTAEGIPRQKLQIWITGSSFFHHDIIQSNSDSSFAYSLPGTLTRQLKPGIYSAIVQHPMMDNEFDVYIDESEKNVIKNYPKKGTVIYSLDEISKLQGKNVIEIIANALNDNNIDDTYTKLQFLIEEPFIKINNIGIKYVGDLFTITALTNLSIDNEILITVSSSSFDPDQKIHNREFSGASGIVKVLKSESGYNKISFDIDLSPFLPDEYVVKATAVNFNYCTSIIFSLIKKESNIISSVKESIQRILKIKIS